MSKEYAEINGYPARSVSNEMREFLKKPGKRHEDGSIMYTTEQHHKDECDVNKIVRKYDKTGLLQHVTRIEAQYGDVSGVEYKRMQDQIKSAQSEFMLLPAKIRKRFGNNFMNLIEFMDDATNRDEAIELGLIKESWVPEFDGMGEHVIRDTPESKAEGEPVTA